MSPLSVEEVLQSEIEALRTELREFRNDYDKNIRMMYRVLAVLAVSIPTLTEAVNYVLL